jgi:hypothetical protein
MLKRVRHFAPLLGLLLVLAACAAPTGSLQVTITGLPPGQNVIVNVAGPGSYGTILTDTTTLAGLTPGTYTVTAGTVTTTAVTTEYDATITPGTFSVVAGETANVAVSYNPTGGTLAVSISGLPAGVDADVNVTGPDAFDQDLTTSTVLTDLTPGDYSASANPVSNGTNDYTPTITGSPAEVSSSPEPASTSPTTSTREAFRSPSTDCQEASMPMCSSREPTASPNSLPPAPPSTTSRRASTP